MQLNRTFANGLLALGLTSALAFGQTQTPRTGTQGSQPGTQGQTGTQSETQGQTGSQSGTQGQTGARSGAGKDYGMSSHKGAGLMVGKQDQAFMTKAAQSNMMEIESAQLAQEKATSQEIKDFARTLEQEHKKASEKLKEIAEQKNIDLPSDMGKHTAQLEKVRNKSGNEFDRAWINMQVSHHKKDVKEFQKQSNRAMDSDVKSFASSTLPTLQDHLRQAQELQGSTRGRSADTDRTSDADRTPATDRTPSADHAPGADHTPGATRNPGQTSDSPAPNRDNNPTPQP